MSSVSGTQTAALPRPGIGMDANAHPCPTVSRICCLTGNPGGSAGWRQYRHRATQAVSVECLKGHLGRNTPMRLLTVEIVDGETTGKRAAWSLPAAMWSRRRQSLVRRDAVDHCAEVLFITKIERAHR